MFLTVPKMNIQDRSADANSQRELDGVSGTTNELSLPQPSTLFTSVTENTTKHLDVKEHAKSG
jgi:hypothetical protein